MKAGWSRYSWVSCIISAIIEESPAITYIIQGRPKKKEEKKKRRRFAHLSPNNKNIDRILITSFCRFHSQFTAKTRKISRNSKFRTAFPRRKMFNKRERHLLPAIFMKCDFAAFPLATRNNITRKKTPLRRNIYGTHGVRSRSTFFLLRLK